MVVGTIIGASIFVQPSEITGHVPSAAGAAAVWIVSGALTLVGALVCAELASALPRTGGVYVYLSEAFSPALGFLWGWAMFWTMHSGIIAVIGMVFARYLGYFVELGPMGTRVVAIAAILSLSWINHRGVSWGANLQTVFTLAKVLAILVIVAIGFALGPSVAPQDVPASSEIASSGSVGSSTAGPADFLLAVMAGLFAFGGWHMVTYNAEETLDPQRTIPRALVGGVLVVTACYVALNAVYFHLLPLQVVIESSRVAADAADAVIGSGGGAVMSALVMFSTLGALAGIVLAGPRVYYAMARDGLLFSWISDVHPRHRTPHRAIWLQGIWASVLVATGTFRALFTRVVYTEWIFFGLLALGLVLLRRRPDLRRGFRMPWVPILPGLFAAAAMLIVANQFVLEPVESAIGLTFVLLGLPVYTLWARARARSAGA